MTKAKDGFVADESGLFHLHWKVRGTTIDDAATLALANHPGSAAWLWFNGTPVPIYMDDSPARLARRWKQYRDAHRNSEFGGIVPLLFSMANSRSKRT